MYAIRNKRDKRWVYGTDSRYGPPQQRLSYERAKLFADKEEAELQMKIRKMNSKTYETVEVMLIEKPILTQEMFDKVENLIFNQGKVNYKIDFDAFNEMMNRINKGAKK